MTNTGATEPQSKPHSKRTRSRHRASTTSPMRSIHTPMQTIVLPSTQNINPEDNDALNIPPGDGSTISANLPGIQRETPKDGPPSKRTRSTKKQESRNTFQQCSQDTSGPSVNQHNTLPDSGVSETPQICPETEEILETRSTEPDNELPTKRKRFRHRASITPPVHLTHNLLLSTTQSDTLPLNLGTLSTPRLEMPPTSELICLAYKLRSQTGLPENAHILQKGATPVPFPSSILTPQTAQIHRLAAITLGKRGR
eukprot:736713-Pelagomonas_calceolata.AAC.1